MDDKKCMVCGKRFDEHDAQYDLCYEVRVGRGSKFDKSHIIVDICSDCFDKIIEKCNIRPV